MFLSILFSTLVLSVNAQQFFPVPQGCCVSNLQQYDAFCNSWNVPQIGADRFGRCVQAKDGLNAMCSWDYLSKACENGENPGNSNSNAAATPTPVPVVPIVVQPSGATANLCPDNAFVFYAAKGTGTGQAPQCCEQGMLLQLPSNYVSTKGGVLFVQDQRSCIKHGGVYGSGVLPKNGMQDNMCCMKPSKPLQIVKSGGGGDIIKK